MLNTGIVVATPATRFGLKVQRRVVIAQALWWPTLNLSAAAVGIAAAVVVKRGRGGVLPQPDPVPVPAVPVAPS